MYQAFVITRADSGAVVGSVEAQGPKEAVFRLAGGAWGRSDLRAWSGNNRPMAAPGLTPYRYAGRFGVVHIGATNAADALRQAARSITGDVEPARLEVWTPDGFRYLDKLT